MKTLITILFTVMTFIQITGCGNTRNASGGARTSDSTWTFRADQMRPTEGNSRILNGYNVVTWQPNKLSVQLPYTGRAYSGADVMSGKSPLDFISKDFTFTRNATGNSEEIVITPNDVRSVRNMSFTVYNNGTATLNIIMNNRSGIGYSGEVLNMGYRP